MGKGGRSVVALIIICFGSNVKCFNNIWHLLYGGMGTYIDVCVGPNAY